MIRIVHSTDTYRHRRDQHTQLIDSGKQIVVFETKADQTFNEYQAEHDEILISVNIQNSLRLALPVKSA